MYNDRDMDGIEDKYDSSFNTPEELGVVIDRLREFENRRDKVSC